MKEGKFNKIFEKGQKKRKVNYNLIKKMNLEKRDKEKKVRTFQTKKKEENKKEQKRKNKTKLITLTSPKKCRAYDGYSMPQTTINLKMTKPI